MMALVMGYSYELRQTARRILSAMTSSRDSWPSMRTNGDSPREIEFGYFMLLLITAGTETTRNAISIGML